VTTWQRWVRQPQGLWIRKTIFQIHLWTGVGVGLYILVISVTGSILVYSGDLYRWATPPPLAIVPAGPLLSDDQLKEAARRAYPGYHVTRIVRFNSAKAATEVSLAGEGPAKRRLFHPYTGQDLRDSVPFRIRLVSGLVDLHYNLLAGATGRILNGVGAVLSLALGLTGLVIWWPGITKWRRSLALHRRVGWKRVNWDLHSAVGWWSFGFVLLFGITGVYLSFTPTFTHLFNMVEPQTDANMGSRHVDWLMYWLAYVHFGRFGGWKTEIPWAMFGLAPAVLFVTGVVMWWNRAVWPRLPQLTVLKHRSEAATAAASSSFALEPVLPAPHDSQKVGRTID
jgi:uncharacterized iron-regulated membrane protein